MIGLLLLITACGSKSIPKTTSQVSNIFGSDERILAEQKVYPYSAVGRIDYTGCSAFLIGANIVATAAHCVVDEKTGQLRDQLEYFGMQFEEGIPKVKSLIKKAWIGSFQPSDKRGSDWAVLEIEDSLGLKFGTLPLKSISIQNDFSPKRVSLIGHHADFHKGNKLAIQTNCSITELGKESRLLFDCDTGAGISGAPILIGQGKQMKVVALVVSEYRKGASTSVRRDNYSSEYANVAIPINHLASAASAINSAHERGFNEPRDIEGTFQVSIPEKAEHTISLVVSAPFRGGAFTDSEGEILCKNRNSDCEGNYKAGTLVSLYAPPRLISHRRMMQFVKWYCNAASEDFPNAVNRCRAEDRVCQVRVTENLTCGAWYQ